MAEKRKPAFKHPSRCRRDRSSTPALDLLSPYLPGPELFISPPISAIQMRPAYSSARFDNSLSSASSLPIGYAPYSSINPMLSFDSNPILSNPSSFYNESCVVQDLSVRLTAQSVIPLVVIPLVVIPLVVILSLVSKDSFKNLGCQTIHWTVSLEGFLMLFQVQPFLVVTSKQNFIMPSPG